MQIAQTVECLEAGRFEQSDIPQTHSSLDGIPSDPVPLSRLIMRPTDFYRDAGLDDETRRTLLLLPSYDEVVEHLTSLEPRVPPAPAVPTKYSTARDELAAGDDRTDGYRKTSGSLSSKKWPWYVRWLPNDIFCNIHCSV